MDCNPLWFIKCDSVLLAEPLDYSKMIGIINNQTQFMQQCREVGLIFHIYEIIKIIDRFLSPQAITQAVYSKVYVFSDYQLTNIQNKATNLRIMIQCEKFYANKFWLNKKLDQCSKVRIMASLLRIYICLQKMWQFLVGDHPNIKARMRKQKLIFPLNRLELFVNEIYIRLQKIEPYYYKQQNQRYILDIHVLFKCLQQLLFQFPTITKKSFFQDFNLKQTIFSENQIYKNSYIEKFIITPQSPLQKPKIRPRRNTDVTQEEKVKSLDHKHVWARRFSMNIKIHKPSNSLCKISQPKQLAKKTKFPFKQVKIQRMQKQSTTQLRQRINSSFASTRYQSGSRPDISSIKRSNKFQQHFLHESMSPTRIPKTPSRRAIVDFFVMGTVQQHPSFQKRVDFQFQSIKEKQSPLYTLTKYHQGQIRESRVQWKSERLMLGQQEIQISGVSAKSQTEIQNRISHLMYKNVSLRPIKRSKYSRQSMDQP